MSNVLSEVARNGDELADAIEQANYIQSAALADAARTTVAIELARITADAGVTESGEALIESCVDLAAAIAACGPTADEAVEDSVAPAKEKALRCLEAFLDGVHAAEPNELAVLLQPQAGAAA